MILKIFKPFLIVIPLIIMGCTITPQIVIDKVNEEMSGVCANLFLSGAYQEASDGFMKSAFVVSRDENDVINVCNYSTAGAIYSESSVVNSALAGCEERRLNFMRKYEKPLKSCEVYALGNDIK
tara:strand:+ start:122 stop:493 length:372 start_codon:yes stop_codon:yes gene_type:complete